MLTKFSMLSIINSIHKYRTRGAWQQRPVGNIQKLVVHHSAAEASDNPEERLNQIMGWHLANSPVWMGLSYHYVITKNGNIYQTNAHEDLTWHDGVNWNSLGILVDGYFHTPNNNQPTEQQLESLEWLLTKLATKHPEFPAGNNPLQDIVGHRDVGPTACPGDILYSKLVEIKQRINQNIENPQPARTPLSATNPQSDDRTNDPISGPAGNEIRQTQNLDDLCKTTIETYKKRIEILDARVLDLENQIKEKQLAQRPLQEEFTQVLTNDNKIEEKPSQTREK